MRTAATAICSTVWFLTSSAFAQGGGERYTVDPAESQIHWLVYKAGALSRLGHNHTIAVGSLTGSVAANQNDLAASRFELQFDVADLVVDDPALRSKLGADFASVPTPDDIAGTRSNMLSERVLDGNQHPRIKVMGQGPAGRQGMQTLAVTVELLGRAVELVVPTSVSIDGNQIRAQGEFELNHADLGMEPFSVMMGALQVGEKLSFAYDVKARRTAAR